MDIEVRNRVETNSWNEGVANSQEGHLFQTTYWANYMEEYIKADPIYITVKAHDELIGQVLLFKEGFMQRALLRNPLSSISIPISKKIVPNLTCLYGPVILDKSHQKAVLASILNEIEKIANKEHVFMANDLQPPIHGDLDMKNMEAVYRDYGFHEKTWGTFFIDLTLEIETLWMNLKKYARKNVKRCEKEGVTIRKVNDKSDLKSYCELLKEHKNRNPSICINWLNNLRKHLKAIDAFEIFIASHKDRDISALSTTSFNGIINEMGVANSTYASENNLYAQDLIKWKIIKWGHENGHRIFDLSGINPNPQTKKEEGIYRFKAKWGGTFVEYNIYSKIYSENKARVINFAKNLK